MAFNLIEHCIKLTIGHCHKIGQVTIINDMPTAYLANGLCKKSLKQCTMFLYPSDFVETDTNQFALKPTFLAAKR